MFSIHNILCLHFNCFSRLIGKQLAILLQNLQKYKSLELSRVHIIGFSLGAHVSGFAGAELPGLSRITGLGKFCLINFIADTKI